MKRHVALLVALPFAAAAWLSAHCLAYMLVAPGGEEQMHLHAENGHVYFGYGPAFVAFGLTLTLVGLVLSVGEGMSRRPAARAPASLFALLPPVGFTVQEHLEHAIGSGTAPFDVITEPVFLAGLALQLPFAFGAWILTRAVQRFGYGLGRGLARELGVVRPAPFAPPSLVRLPSSATLISPSVLALGRGQRAPPAISSL